MPVSGREEFSEVVRYLEQEGGWTSPLPSEEHTVNLIENVYPEVEDERADDPLERAVSRALVGALSLPYSIGLSAISIFSGNETSEVPGEVIDSATVYQESDSLIPEVEAEVFYIEKDGERGVYLETDEDLDLRDYLVDYSKSS